MCLSFIAWKIHPTFLAVILFNRDEFLDRPSVPPHHWENGVFGPRDGVGGGTWIGVSASGNVAILTNFREPQGARAWPASRGAVVANFLSSTSGSPEEYMASLNERDDQIGGYNVICGNIFSGGLWAHSNRAGQVTRQLPEGLHAVSNGPMTVEWKKMRRGLDLLPDTLQRVETANASDIIFEMMQDDTVLCTEQSTPDTGMPAELEVEFSRMFLPEMVVMGSRYGTRSQSAIFIRHDGSVSWVERTRQPDDSWGAHTSSFQMQAPQPETHSSKSPTHHEEL